MAESQSKACNFTHIPVLLNESIEALNIKPNGIYVDCTAGGGGHSKAILDNLSAEGILISLDKDEAALETCRKKVQENSDKNWKVIKSDFSETKDVLDSLNIDRVDGILADLGVSSHQIDTDERGFSYVKNGPLDMRMDTTQELSAAVVVNTYSEKALADIFRLYGEERFSGRIAAGIVRDRVNEPFTSTVQLAQKIVTYVPSKARGEDQHPARRCFQAIRIEVNHELDSVRNLLSVGPQLLSNGGRMAVISFHSLEDRLVKEAYKEHATPCTCPREFPVCVCGKVSLGKIVTNKPIVARDEEIEINSRAHCCKLRVFERVIEG